MEIKTLDSAASWDEIEDYAAGVSGATVYFETILLAKKPWA